MEANGEPILEARGLGKRFEVGAAPHGHFPRRLARLLFGLRTTRSMWAVRGVDLSVRRGECLGLIGRNGAGKTTLLSLLAGLLSPTEGTVSIRGQAVPLLQFGCGLQSELTVLENLRLACALFGMSRKQWLERRDAVVAFGELEGCLHSYLGDLSMGYQTRVPFSAALHCDMDVLLADEVLAVGDAPFSLKCLERIRVLRDSGVTAVLAAHDLSLIRDHCSRAMLLEAGSPPFQGDCEQAISAYYSRCGLELVGEAVGHSVRLGPEEGQPGRQESGVAERERGHPGG